MEKIFKQIYQFKITLKGIHQPIWRRIQVPDHYTFWDLHAAIQDAMGWSHCHLHAFHVLNPETGLEEEIGGVDDSSWEEDYHATPGWERKMSQYFTPKNNEALYVYDFGDDWQHEVKLEKVLPREENVKYPICLSGEKACPPEDCGGVWGYMNLLEILSDPNHEDYMDTVEWLGEEFNPDYFNTGETVFSDPEQRRGYAFGSMDDFSGDQTDDVEEDLDEETQMRAFSRDYMHEIWEKAKSGNLEGLSPEEMRLARIMKDHEDEFFNEFEFSDLTYDHKYDPDTEVNPFLHVFIHSVVENQLSEREPIEVFQFYNAMRKKKRPHHDSIHLIGAILAPLMFSVIEEQRPFDIDTYKHLLKKYKTRNPEKLFDLLDKESKLYPHDSSIL